MTALQGQVCVGPGCFTAGNALLANKIVLQSAPVVRVDSVGSAVSHLATPLSPAAFIEVTGAGFGSDAQLLLNGAAVPLQSKTAARLTAIFPASLGTSNFGVVTVLSGGITSNPVVVPIAAAAPALFSADGSGFGQGYILNSDGTLNSPANPAAPGSAITIFASGVGSTATVGPYLVAAQTVSVFIDDVYANGIAAMPAQVPGAPGSVYRISVYVPNPAFFKLPAQVPVILVSGTVFSLNPAYSVMRSQPGLALSLQQ